MLEVPSGGSNTYRPREMIRNRVTSPRVRGGEDVKEKSPMAQTKGEGQGRRRGWTGFRERFLSLGQLLLPFSYHEGF